VATDNRTLLNGAESSADSWAGDDTANDDSTAGSFYQGSQGISTQLSNSLERMVVSTIGGTRDMSDAQVWMLVKDNLVQTQANGGFQIVLDDGTDEIGFYVGGNDNPPLQLPTFFLSMRLDVSEGGTLNTASRTNAYGGSFANLTETAITGVGYGTQHLAKAVGSIDNVFMDAMYFIVNGNYALTIDAGTVGTPETFSDVVTDDIANGWGMIANLQGSKFDINASWEWAPATTNGDSYFEDSNFQVFIDARDVGAGNFIVRTLAGTGTNSLVLSSGSFINLGTASVWDLSDADFNTFELTSISWTDVGAITFLPNGGTSRFLTAAIFNNCGQVFFDTLTVNGATFNGTTDATGAVLLDDTSPANQDDLIFNSDGTGHAVRIRPPASGTTLHTYDIQGWKFNDYAGTDGSTGNEAILIDPVDQTDDITINITGGGDTPTIMEAAGYTGTVTVNNNVQVTLTGMKDNTEVRVCAAGNPNNELAGIENATAGTTDNRSFSFSLSAGTSVDIIIFNVDWVLPPNNRIDGFTIPSGDTSIPISQVFDRNFNNP